MNRNANTLTIGQAFAARWLSRKYSEYKDRANPEDLFEGIADAVDNYADRKTEEFRSQLRDVALKAANGETTQGKIEFGADEILKHERLVAVAKKWMQRNLDAIYKFPV